MKFREYLILCLKIQLLAITTTYSQEIQVKNAWARPSLKGRNSAVYFTLLNPKEQKDTIIKAISEVAEIVEIHETFKKNEMMEMRAIKWVELPSKSEIKFKPGGYHIMLINLNKDLKKDDLINVRLIFKHSKEIKLSVPVKED